MRKRGGHFFIQEFIYTYNMEQEKNEIYSRDNDVSEDTERLKRIEYPNYVSERLFTDFELEGKKVLDAGAGPNAKFAEYIENRGGTYVPIDLRADALKEMQKKLAEDHYAFRGVQADVRRLPFNDSTFDYSHQRFVLMNIKPETRAQALNEILRVTKGKTVLIEYDWKSLRSTEDPDSIERFKELALELFASTATDPYMGQKFDELIHSVDPSLQYALQKFEREEDTIHVPELILNMKGMEGAARNIFKNTNLADGFKELIESMSKNPIKFIPPDVVAATITKQ